MTLTESEVEILKYEAESIGMSWYEDYKGRYMVNAPYAISGTHNEYSTLISNLVSMLKTAALDSEVDEADGYENIIEWLLNTRTDNMGVDYIWY